MDVDRPPRFVFREIVRLVTATGDERDAVDEPCDVPLVGQEVVVQGAVPTTTEDGWLIRLGCIGKRSLRISGTGARQHGRY
jgi:hypothetical protein